MLFSEEFEGGEAGGGGLAEPVAEIESGGLGIPKGTAV